LDVRHVKILDLKNTVLDNFEFTSINFDDLSFNWEILRRVEFEGKQNPERLEV
jgi:hypothetical protein